MPYLCVKSTIPLIKDKRYEEAFEHIGNETKRGLLPSNDTLKLILNLDEPPELLSQLRMKLPLETEWYDLISEEEVKRKSFQIYVLWKEGKHEEALESIFDLYNNIIEGMK